MIDYAACIRNAYPSITEEEFSLSQDETGLSLAWYREDPAPTLQALANMWLPIVKIQALADVHAIRQAGLDRAARSAGILTIYETNYSAAENFLAGNPSAVLHSGMTAEAHLTGFGANLGMTALQFANYVIAENHRVAPAMYSIERRYLALTYTGDTELGIMPIAQMGTEESVLQAVEDFKTFCGV